MQVDLNNGAQLFFCICSLNDLKVFVCAYRIWVVWISCDIFIYVYYIYHYMHVTTSPLQEETYVVFTSSGVEPSWKLETGWCNRTTAHEIITTRIFALWYESNRWLWVRDHTTAPLRPNFNIWSNRPLQCCSTSLVYPHFTYSCEVSHTLWWPEKPHTAH